MISLHYPIISVCTERRECDSYDPKVSRRYNVSTQEIHYTVLEGPEAQI